MQATQARRTLARRTLARLRNHIVTGFIFIMPVLITIAVIMKFWGDLMKIGGEVSKVLRVDTVLGPTGDAVIAVLLFLLVCIAAGYLVRYSFLKRISERIDQQLESLIPGYGQIRAETKTKVGVEQEPVFDACLVKVQELWQPGYVIEQNADGTQTVFVPQAPAVGCGQVYVVHPGQIRKLEMNSAALNARLGARGRGLMNVRTAPVNG